MEGFQGLFQRKRYFSKIPGDPTFSRRVQLLPGMGVKLLIPIGTYYIEHECSRGGCVYPTPPPPLHPSGSVHDIQNCLFYSIYLQYPTDKEKFVKRIDVLEQKQGIFLKAILMHFLLILNKKQANCLKKIMHFFSIL